MSEDITKKASELAQAVPLNIGLAVIRLGQMSVLDYEMAIRHIQTEIKRLDPNHEHNIVKDAEPSIATEVGVPGQEKS